MEETTLKPNNSTNSSEKPYNFEPNVEAMLCYLPFVGLFTSIVILSNEKKNMFVRFHALQALLFALAYLVLSMGLGLTIILAFTIPIVNMAAFAGWLFMMWKAYENEEFEIPIIGKVARDQLKK